MTRPDGVVDDQVAKTLILGKGGAKKKIIKRANTSKWTSSSWVGAG